MHLLAHLRTAGWLFNPLAVYYCFDAGELAALLSAWLISANAVETHAEPFHCGTLAPR